MMPELTHNPSCECCKAPDALPKIALIYDHGDTSRIKANLCNVCSAKGHVAGHCKSAGCGAIVWTCARLTHVTLLHPGIVEQRENMPELADPVRYRYLGRYYPNAEKE